MRKNLEKRLIWVVAAALSLNGTPFTSKAYAQLSPPTSEQFKAPSPETTLAEAEARDEDTNEIPAPSSLAAENTLQKADGSEEESVLKVDSQEDFRNQETPANLESEIAKGLSNAFGQEYMVTIPTPEIAAGITREVMANGGLPVVADNKVPFSYSGVNGEAGTGVAVRGFDGSILGVELTKSAEETDVTEEVSPEQRLASWKESISGKYPEEKVEFSQFGPGMNPPAGYTLVDTFYYGADRGGVYALVKIQEPGDDVNKRFEEWKSSVLNDYPNAVFVDVRAGQNPPDGFDWFSKFELRANEVIVYAGTPKFMIDGGGKRLPEDLNRDGIVDTKDDAYAVEISDNNKDGVVDGKDAAYTAQDSNMDGVVDGKDAAYTAQDSNMDGAVDSRDAALTAPDSNKVGIIDINDVSSPVTNETPFEYPVGPASPYVNTQASDPDYTPIVVIPEERPIESGEDSSLQAKTEKNISEKSQAAESSYAALALPESVPVENVPQDKGMMTLEEAVKRNDGFIKDIDPKNPSQSTCEGGGGTQIKSPGGVGPTAWFCDGSPAPKSSGPAAADFAPAEKTVVSTENSPEPVKPEIEIDTASNSKPLLNKDGSVWARPVVFKNPSTEVAADAPSLEIRSLTPSLNQKEEEVVRITLNTPVVASFVRAVQSFQREYKPRSDTLSALRAEIKAAYRDVKAIVSEEAEKRIEEAKAEAENKVQDVRAAFDNAKESARASALPERNEGRSAVQSKKEKREALRETIVLIKRKADARIAEFSNLYQSADKLIKEYKQAYTAGTPFPAMTASENSTVFTTENGESLLG